MLATKTFKTPLEKFLGVHKQKKSIKNHCILYINWQNHNLSIIGKSNIPGSAFLILNQFLSLELG